MKFWIPKCSQNEPSDCSKMYPRSHQKIDGNSMPFQGSPRGPKSLQNLRKTMVFQGFGGWLLGRFSEVFWCPKGLQKSMQIPLDFWMDFWSKKGAQMEAKMPSKMHPKINGKIEPKMYRKMVQNGPPK